MRVHVVLVSSNIVEALGPNFFWATIFCLPLFQPRTAKHTNFQFMLPSVSCIILPQIFYYLEPLDHGDSIAAQDHGLS
jgi:hypothetical protein